MEADVAQWIEAFSYPAVFLLLVLCGLGAPLSEDVVLLTGGVVAAESGASLVWMVVVGYLGVVAGDTLLFALGRRLGLRLRAHPWLARLLLHPRVELLRALLARRGLLAVVLIRYLPGLRAPGFLLSGLSNMPLRHFLLADGLSALLPAALLTWLGYRFGHAVLREVQVGLHWLLAGAAVAVVVGLTVGWLRRRARGRSSSLSRVARPEEASAVQ